MHPVGPRPSQVYWLRRLIVVVAGVAVLLGVIFLVAGRSKGASSQTGGLAAYVSGSTTPSLTGVLASQADSVPAGSSAAGTATARSAASAPAGSTAAKTTAPTAATTPPKTTPKTTPPKTSASTTAAPKTTAKATGSAVPTSPGATAGAKTAPKPITTVPAPTAPIATSPNTSKPTAAKPTSTAPSTDAQGRLLCPDAALKLTASTGTPGYPVGTQPILGVSVANVGSVACTRDLSGGLQVFSVYTAAGARVWSTADCFPGTGTDVRTLQAGETVQYNIKWSATTSSPGCTTDRIQVPAGSYQVRVAIGSLRATPAPLAIN